MIESIEGKRGMPRLRPPYVAQVGLFGRPTLEHNMETLYWVRDILEKGARVVRRPGPARPQGAALVLGVGPREEARRAPRAGGHHRARADRRILRRHAGRPRASTRYLPGGASGGILPASLGDIPLDFDTLQPHGCFIGSAAVIVLSQHDRARDAALNLMRFFADESCGQCTPCRVGTAKAVMLMERPRWDTALLDELSRRWPTRRSAGSGRRRPTRSPAW